MVGYVFIAEFMVPPFARGARWLWNWLRDLRDLRQDLSEVGDEDLEGDEEEDEDD